MLTVILSNIGQGFHKTNQTYYQRNRSKPDQERLVKMIHIFTLKFLLEDVAKKFDSVKKNEMLHF